MVLEAQLGDSGDKAGKPAHRLHKSHKTLSFERGLAIFPKVVQRGVPPDMSGLYRTIAIPISVKSNRKV